MWDLLQISFGTASLAAFVYAIWPNIFHREVKYRRHAWATVAGFLVLTLGVFLWTPAAPSGFIQSDTVQVSARDDEIFTVYYPRPYAHPPNLKINFVKGTGTISLVDQLPGVFRFKVKDVAYISGEGAFVAWSASGKSAN
jgi:hypothetical protein